MSEIKVGTKVEVFDSELKNNLGDGIYMGVVETPIGKSAEIKLDNGNTVYGFECWWHPKEEAENNDN